MSKSTYSEKLKDPRWQKKRLEMLERDGWKCVHCQCSNTELHVHHAYYIKGAMPWDYPNSAFITLCKDCHFTQEKRNKELLHTLSKKKHATLLCIPIAQALAESPGPEGDYSLHELVMSMSSMLNQFINVAIPPNDDFDIEFAFMLDVSKRAHSAIDGVLERLRKIHEMEEGQ